MVFLLHVLTDKNNKYCSIWKTNRDRPKSLKNSKRTSKCQFTVLENRKTKKMDRVARRGPLARAPGALKGGHFRNCQHFCRSWRGTLWRRKPFEKKSLNAEKLKGGTLWDFQTPNLLSNIKEIEGGTLWREKMFRKKSHNAEKLKGGPFGVFHYPFCRKTSKKWRGDPLISPAMVCYAGKQKKLFWFSSLGQMVQFGAIIFCRTFKKYFGQFVWIEKKSL